MLNSIVQFTFLAIITGIPFYFQYWIQTNPKATAREVNAMSSKLCIGDLALLLISSFVSTGNKTENEQIVLFGAVFLSVMLLFSFRSKANQNFREIKLTSKERLKGSVRGACAVALILAMNYGVAYTLAPFIGIFASVAIAIMVMITSAPMVVRVLYSCNVMHPSALKDEISAIFERAGVQLGEIYLMDTTKTKVSNAMVCGSKYGFGPFRRSLFLTENIFEVLNEEELKAVICHEASHFQLHHVAKRGFAALMLFMAAIVCVSFPIVMIMMLVDSKNWMNGLVVANLLGNLAFQFTFIFRVIRKHEFEADLNAVTLGANPAALVSALEKVTDFNGGSRVKEDFFARIMMGSGHPTLEERSHAILSHTMPASSKIFPQMRFIASYAAIVLVISAVFLTAKKPANLDLNREIASEKNSTDQSVR